MVCHLTAGYWFTQKLHSFRSVHSLQRDFQLPLWVVSKDDKAMKDAVLKGQYQLVFIGPESLIQNLRCSKSGGAGC